MFEMAASRDTHGHASLIEDSVKNRHLLGQTLVDGDVSPPLDAGNDSVVPLRSHII